MTITGKKESSSVGVSEDKMMVALSELMAAFTERYAPAHSWNEADEHYSAMEIRDMFTEVYPIPPENIFDALRDAGFKCLPLSDRAAFAWLLTLKRK